MRSLARRRRLHAFRRVLTVAVASLILGGLHAVPSEARDLSLANGMPAHPEVSVSSPASGSDAIRSLGGDLSSVAAFYGWTASELSARLASDSSLWVDQNGYLFYKDPVAAAPSAAPVDSPPEALVPLADTFTLHSLSGAKKVIYLDFDGHLLHNDAWTDGYNNGADIVAPPYDTDGNPGSFSSDELTTIQHVWQGVAEDYAPFAVDVTTEYPGESAITLDSDTDTRYGTRALISSISSYFGPYAGIAYLGAFSWGGDYYLPALIFSDHVSEDQGIANVISHEVGHNLGLNHDGTTTGKEYYPGHASGTTGWGPIMGNGGPINQWSKGEYLNANNHEDDVALIAAMVGSVRPDEAGDTRGTAAAVPGDGALTALGVVGASGDVDYYAVASGAGTLAVTASPAALGPNLDILLEIRDASGGLVASGNPYDPLSASLSATVAPGIYYIGVRGTGKGDPLVDGYTSYGSMGAYTLWMTVPASPFTVLGLSPSEGPIAGGNSVVITGAGFTGASAVTFGGIAVTSFTVSNANQIIATAPAHAAGAVQVQVTTPGGSTADTAADDYSYLPPLKYFEQTDPHLAWSGSWTTATSTLYSGGSFNYANSTAAVTIKFSGMRLDLIGTTAYSYGKMKVTIDGASTTVDLYTPTALYKQTIFSSGLLAPGEHTVVMEWTGEKNPASSNTYVSLDAVEVAGDLLYGPPSITSLSPSLGSTAGDTSVIITGSNLTGATAVSFGASPASSYVVNSATKITAVAPAQAAGAVRVQVTTPSGTTPDTAADDYTYALIPVPAISSVAPTSGSTAGGTSVIITGTDLTGATAVSFGGSAASSYVVNSATKITATSPAHAAGAVDVRVTTPGGTSPIGAGDQFTYVTPVPVTGYEQSDTRLYYSGTWTVGSSSVYSGSSYKYTNTAGSFVTLAFNGTGLSLLATKSPSQGKALVSVDGGASVTVDLYRSATAYKQTVFSITLANGLHTVKITRAGTKNPASTGYTINLDALAIAGSLTAFTKAQETDTRLFFSGTWLSRRQRLGLRGRL